MARKEKFLSDEKWEKIEPLLPKLPKNPKGGRPWKENRDVLEGILWMLKTGAPWRDLPAQYPSASTCWRRLQMWEEQGVWLKVWRTFLAELDEKGQLDWSESFADGSFAPAKKGALVSGKPAKGKAQSGWWWSTAKVFLWETTWTRRTKTRLRSSKKR